MTEPWNRLTATDDPDAVAAAVKVHLSTVCHLQQRFMAAGKTADGPPSGRPHVTTPRQNRHTFRHHWRDPFKTADETDWNTIGNHQMPISGQTVREPLADRDLHNCRLARRPNLTRGHRLTCLQ